MRETSIHSATKISTLLAQYPRALDVLVAASPAFEKLRNPVLRKMFASRVSIEQAARIGGVPSDVLLATLREECGASTIEESATLPDAHKQERPEVLARVKKQDVLPLDVREDLAQNHDPFQKIMRAVKQLQPHQVLHLINGFEPIPLYNVLGNRGFEHWTEQIEGVWHVYFFKASQSNPAIAAVAPPKDEPQGGIIELDVSGLEPPEPMQRILATLPSLAGKTSLLVHHHREPLLLYDQLKTRGFAWHTEKLADGRYKILISRDER